MIFKKTLLILLLLTVSGCTPYYAPGVSFRNMSDDKIHNIRCDWVGKNLGLSTINPGKSATELFYIRKRQDYFGQVTLTWENAEGKQFSKAFEANPETIPLLAEPFDSLSGVSFYFTQESVDYLLGKKGENSEEELRRGSLMHQIRINAVRKKQNP